MPSSKYVHTLQTCQYKLNNVRCLLYIHAVVSSTPVLVWKPFLAQLKVYSCRVLAGQRRSDEHNLKLTEQLNHPRWHVRFIAKHRRAVGFLLPVCFVHFIYWSTFISYGRWYLYREKYVMTLTMVFGGLIAGILVEIKFTMFMRICYICQQTLGNLCAEVRYSKLILCGA